MDVPTRYAFLRGIITLAADIMEARRPWRSFLISSHMVSELENALFEDAEALKMGVCLPMRALIYSLLASRP